jgi:3',5'-cyclic AMP phosphodiesterase CpdA
VTTDFDRRDFLKLAGLGGVVFASGLGNPAFAQQQDFFFVQLSDTHWGFRGPAVNPEATTTLRRAVAAVNALERQPDFIVFTGDLTHTTDDAQERRRRMTEFKQIVADLHVRDIHFLAGEHDASLDRGEAFREFFGPTNYTFDHKGVHFIALDNVSDPQGKIGTEQLAWLRNDLAQRDHAAPIVVLTHRPLFDLYPDWDWATADGADALALLMPFQHVVVFYGHIHQENHHMTQQIAHHAAQSLIFPQPAPGSQPRRAPVPWDAAHPFQGLGFRGIQAAASGYTLQERGIA